ncbi:MAG: glycosyltransferase [Proteobacteria bacterium]|nr:glycosyltransferase [Pseudomonadota bacterium]
MKVLVVHNAYQSHFIGGEDLVVQREVKALKQVLGHENVFEYFVSNDDIQMIDLATKLWGNQIHFKHIANMVKKHAIDIVHVHNFFPLLTPSVFSGAKFAGAKVVHTLHNFRWWCTSGILYRDNQTCEQCVEKAIAWPGIIHKCYRNSYLQSIAATLAFGWYRLKEYAKHIDAYFVLSEFQAQKLKPVLNAKMLLKPNGIEAPVKLNTTPKKGYLFVGRLESAKGIELLLETFAKLPKQFCLSIIGTGENEQALRQTYASENIVFLGQLPHEQVLENMAKSKYFIHSSLTYETFGLTLVEALSVGTPVIALNRGPRAEFIQSGVNGFLCLSDEIEQTILKAEAFADYDALSKQAFESAKPFYMNNIIQKQISYYEALLSEAKS